MHHTTTSRRRLCLQSLEPRCVLAVTLADLTGAGISQRVVDYIDTSTWEAQILDDDTLQNTLSGLNATQAAPPDATVLTSVADLSQITEGTVSSPNAYLIQGDLSLTDTIEVPSNVHIYVDGSIYKRGDFSTTGSVFNIENTGSNADAIFRLNGTSNVKLIGVNNALLHSNPTLDASQPHTTAVFIHTNSSNVEVDGFEMAYVWNGVAAHPFNIHDVTVTNNYIRDTLNRAVWSLGTTSFRAAHNFVENAGMDSFDWDAFTNDAIAYENVSIGAGRWAGFVEEGTEDSFFIRGLGMIADFGNPNRSFMLGWADNGSSEFFVGNNPNPSQWTEHNYFIDNVMFTENNVPQSGGDYFAKNNAGKGPTYFWANRGFGAGQSQTFFDNAEWLTFLPSAGGRNNEVNAIQMLAELDAEFNDSAGIVLLAPTLSVANAAPAGTVVGSVTVLSGDPATLDFEIVGGDGDDVFEIDDDGQITVAGPIEFATKSAYALEVEATDGVETGAVQVTINVLSPFATVETLFDHDFAAPVFFNSSDVRGQQGWTAQNGWAVQDAAGVGYAASSTTAFQGVTNGAAGQVSEGGTLRVEVSLELDVTLDATSDLFRFGLTTLDGSGTFVPSLGNNGGEILSSKVRYNAANDSVEVFAEETAGASVVLDGAQIGIDRFGGDVSADPIRLVWEATKGVAGQWDIVLAAKNEASGADLGSASTTVTDAAAYNAAGLYAGVRGLQNSSQSVMRFDRFVYQAIEPGTAIPGDYNADGSVDAADYTVWRDQLGQSGPSLAADGDRDGQVTQDDYAVWAANFGATATALSARASALAYEPASAEPIADDAPSASDKSFADDWLLREQQIAGRLVPLAEPPFADATARSARPLLQRIDGPTARARALLLAEAAESSEPIIEQRVDSSNYERQDDPLGSIDAIDEAFGLGTPL